MSGAYFRRFRGGRPIAQCRCGTEIAVPGPSLCKDCMREDATAERIANLVVENLVTRLTGET